MCNMVSQPVKPGEPFVFAEAFRTSGWLNVTFKAAFYLADCSHMKLVGWLIDFLTSR